MHNYQNININRSFKSLSNCVVENITACQLFCSKKNTLLFCLCLHSVNTDPTQNYTWRYLPRMWWGPSVNSKKRHTSTFWNKFLTKMRLYILLILKNKIFGYWWRFREPILIDGSPFYPCKRTGSNSIQKPTSLPFFLCIDNNEPRTLLNV